VDGRSYRASVLLAEIKKKLGRALASVLGGTEGEEPAIDYFDFEDVLTSNVFGALRYLEPKYGLEPVLRRLGLAPIRAARVDVWEAEDGCEPDVIIDLQHSVVLVEAKLRAPFGDDQLEREVVFAHRRAGGRPWRLLCVTTHHREPAYRGTALAKGVASSFADENALGLSPCEIERRIAWMPWSEIATRLEESLETLAPPPHAVALIEDVLASLCSRGLMRPPFHGFGRVPPMSLAWAASPWSTTAAPPSERGFHWRVPALSDRWRGWLLTAHPHFAGFGAAGRLKLEHFHGWFSSRAGGRDG
jgi:hypothetical protein